MSQSSETNLALPAIKPMRFWASLLFFGLPALAFVIGFHGVMPLLISAGALPFYAYASGVGSPLLGLLLGALIALRVDGYPLTWLVLKERLRLKPMDRKSWLWAIGILLLALLVFGALSMLTDAGINKGLIPLPSNLPAFLDPRAADSSSAFLEAFGYLKGNWLGLGALTLLLIGNIIGEEVWWRGYILPRQEAAFGRWVWVIHGVMWAFFHIFKWWDVVALLPATLGISYLAYRLKNTTATIIVHFAFNGLSLVGMLLMVIGLV